MAPVPAERQPGRQRARGDRERVRAGAAAGGDGLAIGRALVPFGRLAGLTVSEAMPMLSV